MKRARGRHGYIGVIVLALLAAAGCKRRGSPGSTTTSSASEPVAKAATSADDPHAYRPPVETVRPLLQPVIKILPADGLRGPACVLHDDIGDAYYVSNVDGPPLAEDGKAFISKLTPDGKKMMARWIEAGKHKVELNAPKGMAVKDDELYVADIDTVRIFHRITGLPIDNVKITGAKSLDAVTVADDGRILVTDSGLKANGDELEATGVEGIYSIQLNKSFTNISLLVNQSLGTPTGLFASRKKIWAVGSRSGEIYSLGINGKLEDPEKLPVTGIEGLVGTGEDLLFASRTASAIFRGRPKGKWWIVIGDVKSPGDIGFDEKRKRVLVPLPTEDEVRIYNLN